MIENIPLGGWTCFHCGESFDNRRCAAIHFGADEDSVAACQIRAGAERSLLEALRQSEAECARLVRMLHDESTDAAKAYYGQQCRHHKQLQAMEEMGYERGLRDARAEILHNV